MQSSAGRNSEATVQDSAQSERLHSQSLRSKIVLALALMLGIVVGIEEFVRQYVIATEFIALERVTALKETNRVLSAINTEIDYLTELAHRETGLAVHNPEQTIKPSSASNRIQWRALVDQQGSWNWITRPENVPDLYPRITRRLDQKDWTDSNSVSGISVDHQNRLILFAAVQLRPSQDPELSTGKFYVVGRPFDGDLIGDLQRRTSVPFSISRLPSPAIRDGKLHIQPVNESLLSVHSPLLNPQGDVLAELLVSLPRDLMIRSKRTTAIARYLSLCGVCGSLLMLFLLLQRLVIGRLETIRQHTERIAQSGLIVQDTDDETFAIVGNDEIGQLAESFVRMRDRLGDAQRQLSDASHAAGMSLVADTVIHNVGNVLTNVNSLMETVTNRVNNLRVEPLEKLAERLDRDDTDEAFRQATPKYLHRLSETLEGDKHDLSELLDTLHDNIQHIHQVISDQRKHTHQSLQLSPLSLTKLIREGIKCVDAKLREDSIRVEADIHTDVTIWSDRSLLLQILINIITNAGNAASGNPSPGHQPLLQIDVIKTRTAVRIRFRDNGCGMDQSTLSRVFDAHFTTRESGSGLGLHFCANALKRLGGAITAMSDGLDQGATFIIELPLRRPDSNTPSSETDTDDSTSLTPDDTVKLSHASEMASDGVDLHGGHIG
ncbi:HAMP domain-containing histidine kinase [Stieleria sp. JC731]|uniref:sensor histidine kinase n=1 Tax=Pirellulaceae TaxID=2691357 RepID=UPI001E3338F7|nr:HAMP domain-containing sensor histidine kinase [Stieleria sp. JC731]MCC9599547.1 HAMP domain-containing histidine kinase [Stieleria sp. JC731]